MKVILTGSTGMVGKGVLLECIDDKTVENILLINRSPIDISHHKIKEIIHKDFTDFSSLENMLKGYDSCFHCMGVSSAGINEETYFKLTFTISEALASSIYRVNPNMLFTYVSGAGTDGSERGNTMWARVKGKTENMILNMGFKDAYAFRPGVILPERGVKSKTKLYNFFYIIAKPLFPLLKRMKSVTTTSKIGRAMINLYTNPQPLKHLEGAEINKVSEL